MSLSLLNRFGIMAQGGINYENPDVLYAASETDDSDRDKSYFFCLNGDGTPKYTPVLDVPSSPVSHCCYDLADAARTYVYAMQSTIWRINPTTGATVATKTGFNTGLTGTIKDGVFYPTKEGCYVVYETASPIVYRYKLGDFTAAGSYTVPGTEVHIRSICVDCDSKIYVAYSTDNYATRWLCRLNADLTLDTGYAIKNFGTYEAEYMAADKDGNLFVTRFANSHPSITKYNKAGTQVFTVANEAGTYPIPIILYDGTLLVSMTYGGASGYHEFSPAGVYLGQVTPTGIPTMVDANENIYYMLFNSMKKYKSDMTTLIWTRSSGLGGSGKVNYVSNCSHIGGELSTNGNNF